MTAPGDFEAGDILGAADLNALPGGVRGYAKVTSSQGSVTVWTDITGLTATWTAVSSRLYKYTVIIPAQSTSASEVIDVMVTDSSNGVKAAGRYDVAATNTVSTTTLVGYETGLSGSTTRKVRAGGGEGSSAGTITVSMSTTVPGVFIVEDIGPA